MKNVRQPNDYVYGVTCVEYNFGGMACKFYIGLFCFTSSPLFYV